MNTKVVSIKGNFVLSLINTILGVLFPLITLPYITRIIAPEGIGQVQFFNTIIDYIVLFTSIGIPLYAVREVAKLRDEIENRNQLTVELLVLHLLLTIIGYIVVIILSLSVPKIQENIPVFLLLSVGLFLNTIGVQWFFQAIEDFVYITIRSLIVKLVCLVLLFLTVKTNEDLLPYAFIQLLGIGGNYIFNFIRLNKIIGEWGKYVLKCNIIQHIVPSLKVFLLNITVGVYTQLSYLLLGFICGNEAVGLYTMPFRFVNVSLSVITALGAVLLPRFSNYVGRNNNDSFVNLGNKATSFITALVLPMSAGLFILSEPITLLICGDSFIPSIMVLRLLSPLIIIIGISQIYGKYMLYPMGKELLMVICTLIGLVVYIILGIPLINCLYEKGAAIATLVAEISVTISILFAGRKYIKCKLIRKENIVYFVSTLIMSIVVLPSIFIQSNLISVIVGLVSGIVSYFFCLKLFKDPLYNEAIQYIKAITRTL